MSKTCFKFILSIAIITLLTSPTISQVSATSGDGSLLRKACVPPDSPPYHNNETEEIFHRLRLEGNCFLQCIEDGRYLTNPQINRMYPSWPFLPRINDPNNCSNAISQEHECVRGCRLFDGNIPCIETCINECRQECNGFSCTNPDSMGLWMINPMCKVKCSHNPCVHGCSRGQYLLYGRYSLNPPIPLSSRLNFRLFSDTDESLFVVELPITSENGMHLTGFLYKVQDLLSTNVTYIWQQDPREPLNLSGYGCRDINISLTLVDSNRWTSFTDPVQLYIEGEEPQIPNPPESIVVSEVLDPNLFQHVIIKVRWNNPQDDIHLMNYVARLTPLICISLESALESLHPYDNLTSGISMEFRANGMSLSPLMGCTYAIEISSVGKHGDMSQIVEYEVPSLQNYMNRIVSSFNCEKRINVLQEISPMPYFEFTLSWSLSKYQDDVSRYVLDYYIYDPVIDQGLTSDVDRNSSSHPAMIQQYTTPYLLYSQPRHPENFFIFKLSIIWSDGQQIESPYSCNLSTLSPPPSEVLNIVVWGINFMRHNQWLVNASWTKPSEPNGVLSTYQICLPQVPLKGNQPGRETDPCINVTSDQTSIAEVFKFNSNYNSANFQVQAINTFATGNWSTSLFISLPPDNSRSSLPAIIAGTMVPISIMLLCTATLLVILLFIVHRRRKKLDIHRYFNDEMKVTRLTEDSFSDPWELDPAGITVDEKLGQGAFGVVNKGCILGPLLNKKVKVEFRNATDIPVSIKILKFAAMGSEKNDFLMEIEMMKKVSEGHNPHVVAMLGCVTTQEPLCLVTEFVKHGTLLSYLRKKRNPTSDDQRRSHAIGLSPGDFLNFSYQITDGLDFLFSKGIIHRDLACRNILVDEGQVLKIINFGLSRETEKYMKSSARLMPFKWMPLEFLETGEFTFASDVWSFGIVMWEIATYGGDPYPGINNHEILAFLKKGSRLKKPEEISNDIYDIMLTCWDVEQSKRPKFSALKQIFSDMLLSQRTTNECVMLGESAIDKVEIPEEAELESASLGESDTMKSLDISEGVPNPLTTENREETEF